MLTDLTQWVTDIVESLGYVGVALLVAIENIFPPIPSEVVLGLAGFVAARGDASAYGMIAAATVGSLVGAWVLYGISAWIGPVRMRALVVRYGGWIRMTEADLDRAEGWFDSKARLAVLICRCIPLIRSLISIPAGFRRMPIGQFTLYTVIGSLVWNSALVGAGYALGDRWEKIVEYMEQFQNLVILVIVVAVGWYVWTRFLSPKRRGAHPHHTLVE